MGTFRRKERKKVNGILVSSGSREARIHGVATVGQVLPIPVALWNLSIVVLLNFDDTAGRVPTTGGWGQGWGALKIPLPSIRVLIWGLRLF